MSVLSYPDRIVLELTPICNLSCFMCPRHIIGKNPGYMTSELWTAMIDEIASKSTDSVILPFWRGESLLHKKFIPLSNYALDKGMKLHISTNGHYVEGEKAEVLSRYEFITFSIHTDDGFKKAVEFAKQYKSESNTLQVSFVDAEKDLQHYMNKVLEDPELMGFDAVRLYNEHSIDGEFGYNGLANEAERFFCPKLENTLVIAFDGSISRCNHIWNTELYNVTGHSIADAWQSLLMHEIRTHYPDEQCSKCDQWEGRTSGNLWKKSGHKEGQGVVKIY